MTLADQLREEGIQRGMQQGKKEGMEEGIQQEKRQLAKAMLAAGEPEEKVARYTGLHLWFIKELSALKE